MKGASATLYYYQLASRSAASKGVPPTLTDIAKVKVRIDGPFDDWSSRAPSSATPWATRHIGDTPAGRANPSSPTKPVATI